MVLVLFLGLQIALLDQYPGRSPRKFHGCHPPLQLVSLDAFWGEPFFEVDQFRKKWLGCGPSQVGSFQGFCMAPYWSVWGLHFLSLTQLLEDTRL